MATIRKRGTKYQVQVRRAGYSQKSKSFNKLKDAQEWARHTETQIDRDELPKGQKLLRELTLSNLVTRYRDEIVPFKKGKEIETIILNAFLKNNICKKKLSEITKSDFAKYRDKRLLKIKPNSLKRQLAPLQNMFEIAKEEWNIPIRENPLAKLRLSGTDIRRERRLREGEYQKLFKATQTRRNKELKDIIDLAIETGMRRGEILSLSWSQVDIERRSLTVLESKNGYSRTIPLTDNAIDIFKAKIKADGNVFMTTKDGLKMAWGRITSIAGIEDLRFHDLRHEAISRFFEMGLTVPEVAMLSGHREIKMLMRYAHARKSNIQKKLNFHQT